MCEKEKSDRVPAFDGGVESESMSVRHATRAMDRRSRSRAFGRYEARALRVAPIPGFREAPLAGR